MRSNDPKMNIWFVEDGKLFLRTKKYSGQPRGWPVRKRFKVLAR